MKFLFLFLVSLSLPLQVQATHSVYQHVWGDFTGFNNEHPAGTDPYNIGAKITNADKIKLDSNGHINLKKGSVTFNLEKGAASPSLGKEKEFCLGLTFQAGKFASSSDSLSKLFFGQFTSSNAPYDGVLDMNIDYNGKTNAEVYFKPPADGEGQITTKIDPSKDLTVFICQNKDDTLTVSFYSGRDELTSVTFKNLTTSGGDLRNFTIGDKNSDMVLKGLGIMVGDSLADNPNWRNEYFDKVEPGSVPEPGAAILALWGGVFALCRRRRAA